MRGTRHSAHDPSPVLTLREAEVLAHVAAGRTNCEVGVTLGISPRTVEKHLEHIYAKLGVSGRFGAMVAYTRSRSVMPQPSSTPPWAASTSRHSPGGGATSGASSRTRTATNTSPSPRRNATVPSPASTGV
jgi:DNA-binding CsgD family transcriptional regulator